ncbi:non-ribosomal peptide synthetase/type I polyketide synthase [Nitrospirillum iridis]|uniref:Amino acid adenylation domain-containing protein n=1 Tax=Nitrospirillum iridis TaxID=765888 RepID=A0A7X0EFG6_9PROT|nr:non-ribosomal peptide synthetase/type I polyketide synthase [Nitrospirillum iridis]MBB6254968.1 amino acid adenylation domain-containing protein [Nitrospirillum iridis]
MTDGPGTAPELASAQETIKRLYRALKAEKQQREALEAKQAGGQHEPVAIIGMACRFPGGANDPEAFWRLLDRGGDAVGTVPADRWDAAAYLDPDGKVPGTMHTAQGGFLDVALDRFDYGFFRLSPKEARALDPQQRLLLEVSWEALESAGIVPATLKRSRTGVFIGLSGDDYTLAHRHSADLSRIDAYSITGSTPSTAAGRIAYFLGLEGPAIPVDTACSSSLVAFHLACQSLREGETDLSLVGGVNLILAPATHVCFSRLQAISPDGRCKSFAASADGYGRGEGCGMVVLKRLADARRDGDPILAVVKATAVNQDGASNGFTAPNGAAQKRLLREALDKAGLSPTDIQYVETHGTGTPLGDPIEAEALADTLCQGRDPARPLVLGAVKSNLGHLEAAAGMAGVLKVLLALRHGRIPPNLHFTAPNPLIPWNDAALRVPTAAVPWPAGGPARHAGISSFGFSGTNAHVILGEAPADGVTTASPGGPALLCLSARTPAALAETARRVQAYLTTLPAHANVRDICATALHHRSAFAHRLAVAGSDAGDVARALDAWLRDGTLAGHAAARAYVEGGPPDAAALGLDGPYRRVDLPGTAFDPQPCHFGQPGGPLVPLPAPTATGRASRDVAHPLLGHQWRSPLLNDTLWEVEIGLGSHPLFRDHRVFGRPVVPAAAYLSMMLAAAGRHLPGRPLTLEGVAFPAALVLPEAGAVTLHLRLRPLDEDRAELRLVRLTETGAVTHATATLVPADARDLAADSPAARWDGWSEALDTLFDSQGDRLTLGPAFRRAGAARRAGDDALARLEAGADDGAWQPSFHPGLIDAGLQLLPALWQGAGDAALVPVGVDRVTWSGQASGPQWVAATLTRDPGGLPGGDILLLNADGQPQLHLRGVRGETLSADALRRAVGLGEAGAPPCYRVTWHPSAEPAVATRWIILPHARLPADAFPGALRVAGESALADADMDGAAILDLRALDGGGDLALAAPALRLAQTLARLPAPPRLWIATRAAQPAAPDDTPDPFQATLWGLGRSLAVEQPMLWGGLVDLPAALDTVAWDRLPGLLVPGECALRDGAILVPRLEAASPPDQPFTLRDDATYLITGGLGALGLDLAEGLARRGARHFALLGRNGPTPTAQARLDALAASGTRVLVLAADVADTASLEAALARVKAAMPPLAGFFHLAGRLDDGLLADQTPERLAHAMAGKAGGAWALHELTRDLALDVAVFFASAAGVLGAAAQANYAAANAFLDALATLRRRTGLAGTSLAWGPWAGAGMAADGKAAANLAALGFTPLAPERALAAMDGVLAAGWAQATILAADWARHGRGLPAGASPTLLRGLLPAAGPATAPADLADFLAATAAEVLGATPGAAIDPAQDLFELGLDSLMALRLRNAIEARLGVSLPTTILFDHPTLAGLAQALDTPAAPAAAPTAIQRATDPTALSVGQKGLWFLQQLAPDSAAFHTCFTARVRSALDVDALERAFRRVLDRHPGLRARFSAPDGLPRQDAVSADGFTIERHRAPADPAALRAAVEAAYRRPFRLDVGPPLRVALWRAADTDHVLLVAVHHIAIDVWSFELLLDEVKAAYAVERDGGTLPPPAGRPYADFIAWQGDLLAGTRGTALRDYWRGQLAGAPPPAEPPLATRPQGATALAGRSLHFTLGPDATAALERMGQEQGVTLNMTLLAAWLLLVGRLSGQQDVVAGTPALGRSERAWAQSLGFFVNVLPIRASLAGTWPDFLRQVRRTVLDAIAHQDLPFAEIAALAPQADHAGPHPLFTTLFHLRNLEEMGPLGNAFLPGRTEAIPFGPLEIEPYFLDQQEGQYPLTMEWFKAGGDLYGVLKFDTAHYDAAGAARIVEHYRVALAGLVSQPDAPVTAIDLLTDDDRAVLAAWNDTARDTPAACIHDLLARQAARTPDAPALLSGEEVLSYAALDRRANALAHTLAARGVGPGALVGLCLERSTALVLGVLAVLKAGGAYVPLSPDDPADRLAALARDAGLAQILVRPDRRDRFANLSDDDVLVLADTDAERADAPMAAVTPDDLAYVLFTSGTTGAPKGVMVPHGAVANLLAWCQDGWPLTAEDALLQRTPLTFDPSVAELFWPLATGARLVLAGPDGHRDPGTQVDLIRRHRVTALFSVPSQWHTLLEEPGIAACDTLRLVICGGEALPAALIGRFQAALPRAALVNVYGPTEATVLASAWPCPPRPDEGAVRIGAPIANTHLHVLDEALRPVPPGVAGDLYIAGRGLARGYLNRPDLTDAAFIRAPAVPGGRLYRTGDRASLTRDADGRLSLRFLGRVDHQVKLRGMRLEIGEVETALRLHPDIAAAAVRLVTPPSGEAMLGGCLVPAVGAAITGDDAAAFLADRLPGWMVPRVWATMPTLPLTAHDKVDGAALDQHLRLALSQRTGDRSPTAPATMGAMERTVARIWCDLLNLPAVGRDDHFFDLGGTSLMLARVRRRLEDAGLGDVPIADLFRYPTVAGLAAHLRAEGAVDAPVAVPARAEAGDHAVAVIGFAARFPGAPDVDAFWDNLLRGVESIRRFTRAELVAAGAPAALVDDPAYVPANGVLDGVEDFDAGFFGYSPREAETLDPQQRLFLETVWHALEHGGYGRRGLAERVGIYAGSEISNYLLFNLADRLDPTDMNGGYALSLANDKDFLATRAAYALDLRGPAMTVQTACSTSLTAVAMACDALVSGQCEMALAGGVSIQLPQIQGYRHREGLVASADGHCRPFDAAASGTVNGNGVGVVLLKPLARALADGDTVHAVLKGWAVNNDGSHKLGYTAPNADAQARALTAAWDHAGVRPDQLGYVEAHGTGTPLGDPIEVTGLVQAWGDRPRSRTPCLLGSVKGNIGHLGAASGVAGLIKAVLTVREGQIPPSLHLDTPNPKIPFAGSPFAVNGGLRPWPGPGVRRAGVSSFGIGGTNVHVVVEQAPAPVGGGADDGWHLLPVSAGSAAGLDAALGALAATSAPALAATSAPALADIAHTLQRGRDTFAHRAAVVVRTGADVAEALARAPRAHVRPVAGEAPDVAFLFPGQGAQHPDMLLDLYRAWPDFRRDIDQGLDLLAPVEGTPAASLHAMLYPTAERREEARAFLGQTRHTQPFLFITEHALARQWQRLGVEPGALMGHSVGEYVAACLAGVFTYQDALRLVAARGRLMQELPAGAMLAVNLPVGDIQPHLSDTVCLAGDNGPTQCVLSGPLAAITAVAAALAERGVTTHALATSHAFHSAMMDPILDTFRQVVAGVARQAPRIPVISCLTGDWLTAEQATDPDYWVRQLRGAVQFRRGVETLRATPGRLMLEVGPGRALSAQAQRVVGRDGPAILTTARRETEKRDDREAWLSALAGLWLAGVDVRWPVIVGARRVPLPLYPFDRQRYWVEPGAARPAAGPVRADAANRFYTPRWTPTALPPTATVNDELTLVFADGAGVAERLAARLGAETVVVNIAGPSGLAHTPAAYAALLARVRSQGPLRRIIHAACLGAPSDRVRTLGLESLLFLGQALAEAPDPVRLAIVAGGVQDVAGDPPGPSEAALLMGPALVLPRECPWVDCRLIDIVAAGVTADLTAGRIVDEMADPRGDRLVAYRHNRRWVRDFQPLAIPHTEPGPLRQHGVYLVTGGLGGIGLAIAEALAQRCQARLVLCGRTVPGPDDSRQDILRRIREAGAEVTVAAADVTSAEDMERLVADTLARHGALHGVIHAAGLASHGALTAKTAAGMAAVLAPKVDGTLVLADAVAQVPLDFLALFSSSSAVLGATGLMDYAAANAFLDTFAHRRSAAGLPTVAIGWDAWADVGMAQGAFTGTVSARQAAQALTAEEGVDAFLRILGQGGLPHIVVSPTDLNAMLADIAAAHRDDDTPTTTACYDRPELATSFIMPSTPTQRQVAALWQEILGIRGVGIHDNFFDLGGDSLVGAKLVARLNRAFAASLPAVVLYEAPTVAALADRLTAAKAPPRPPAMAETVMPEADGRDSRRARRDRKRDDFF